MKMLRSRTTMMMMMICCSVVGGASELAFLKEPNDIIAVRDRPLMLDCQVEGEVPISITWRRNGVPVATGIKATVLGNGTLLIRNFSKRRESNETDAGEYDCAAQNRYGMLISRKARVQLASLPKFLSHPESVAVDEGGVSRLTCQVNGIPEANITWQRDRRPLSTEDPRYTLLPNGVLQITSVQRKDSGLFRCVASNIANTRYSHEAQLSVTVAGSRIYQEPVILSGPQNLTINIHQTAILECIATGNPRPIVSWSRLDGRSMGVEGIQVLGTGNLMISDATVQHSGVYVCSANRPGSRSRRTALGRLVVQAPPEFVQWPQSVSRPAGGSAVFSCTASGVPEPHFIWLKNGKLLTPSGNVKLTNGNTTLAITHITPEDEAIYQCIAENSAGTNQASARLAISQGPELPEAPTGLQATALSSSSLQLTWDQPVEHVSHVIIGYVLHVRRLGEPDSAELQEAVSQSSFTHHFNNLEEATTYDLYLKAYSARGGSQRSNSITATTLGGVPTSPSFFTKVLNQTAMQVYWDLPVPGKLEGFRLEYRRVSNPNVQGQETFPAHVNTHTVSHLEPAAVYDIQLVAFNGNGDSPANRRLVSLDEGGNTAAAGPTCNCDQSDGSVSTLLVGVHSGLACILCCIIFILLGYRRSLFCRKAASWDAPPTLNDPKGHIPENIELSQRCDSAPPPVMVMVEPTSPFQPIPGTR
ncbi:immunoglobulin superfamily DCC subclass member 3-like isoform X1 [Hippoglossus hippoglossus]|uniref:immunoglobulin superfamily DCC subclass member 3-like isoform X1 n=2 Tax=Hippoglossus hippoglossus TaxID=8267 RepID=UPI00148B9B48|nr:immunoglobulin superfamily DCC subclass member 3-like isoform X1 [Hippoglossus hippoglossus]XP_034466330.1 immunoglobulin superfamily DCC subclass member 3-like isoform X1 [Hippoglossus hippoglossus]XP_034466331.1 immunoglobulin superfamily DCC subclass member 3-like isoform X1 [Hippoglossus hippoglossus]